MAKTTLPTACFSPRRYLTVNRNGFSFAGGGGGFPFPIHPDIHFWGLRTRGLKTDETVELEYHDHRLYAPWYLYLHPGTKRWEITLLVITLGNTLAYARMHGLGYGRPGGAWAARREATAGGLYDRHAIGGGDSAMLCAWEGREKLPQSLKYGTAWEEHYRNWASRSFELVRGALACVSGDVVHLYHGSRQNRQYVERYQILYDPVRDVEIDPETGLLQWSGAARERKGELVRRVAQYFERRREDK